MSFIIPKLKIKTCQQCNQGTAIEEIHHGIIEDNGRPVRHITLVYSCGHTLDLFLLPDPITYLDSAIANERWFEGIIMSCAYFENLATQIIIKHIKNTEKKISKKRIDSLTLSKLITFLYSCNLIDQTTYTRMNEVKIKRDLLVHYIKPIYQLDSKESKRILNKARRALNSLILVNSKLSKDNPNDI